MWIRRAEPKDVEAVAAVFCESRRTLTFLARATTVNEAAPFIARRIERNDVYVAEDATGILGFIALAETTLDSLYVSPDAQKRGIGNALFEEATRLRPYGFILWVFQKNEAARRFYERRGCRLLKVTDGADNREHEPDALYQWIPGWERRV